MPNVERIEPDKWQERVTLESPPAILLEHVLRYRLVADLVAASATWIDLGCGTGVPASQGLAGKRASRIVLVDNNEEALKLAADLLQPAQITPLRGDLNDPDFLSSLRELATAAGQGTVITAFELIEHLDNFVPLVELLRDLSERGGATVVFSVPNDAFWPVANPFHKAVWGEASFAELRDSLPDDHVVLHQLQLVGSAVFPRSREEPSAFACRAEVDPGQQTVSTHLLAAFGPRTDLLRPGAAVAVADLIEQRRWENEREANLLYAERQAQELQRQLQRTERAYEELVAQKKETESAYEELHDRFQQLLADRRYLLQRVKELEAEVAGGEQARSEGQKKVSEGA